VTAAGLRRRREAGWRLPPLVDGRRDPLDRVEEPLTDALRRCRREAAQAAWWHFHDTGVFTDAGPDWAGFIETVLRGTFEDAA
jgi:hypothetical protein